MTKESAATKSKAIDLGLLQDALNLGQKNFTMAAKEVARAQEAFDRAKEKHDEAREALKAACRVIIS